MSVGGGGISNSCTDYILQYAQQFVSRATAHQLYHLTYFPNRTHERMSSRMIAQGQALRVASQALPDHPRLHEGDSSGWENVAALLHFGKPIYIELIVYCAIKLIDELNSFFTKYDI